VNRDPAHQVEHNNRAYQAQTGQIIVEKTALTKPQIGARFTLTDSGEVWTIENIPMDPNTGEWVCQCKRSGMDRANLGRVA